MGIHEVNRLWTWQPTGALKTYGRGGGLSGIKTYKASGKGKILSARLTFGLNVLQSFKLKMKNVIDAVKNHRIIQTGDPGSFFQAGRGLYKSTDGLVEEDAVQILITHLTNESSKEFRENAKDLGEFLATIFGQDEVLVEILVNNVIDEVVGATQNKLYRA